MTVRAKFKVQSTTEMEGGLKTANLTPVTSGSPENEQFFKWTPGGQIQLGTINPEAGAQFVPGRQFYVDFTPSDQVFQPFPEEVYVIVQQTVGEVQAKVYYAYSQEDIQRVIDGLPPEEHYAVFRKLWAANPTPTS
jgi:hypothetical protein